MPIASILLILPAAGLSMLIALGAIALRKISGVSVLSPMLCAVLIAVLLRNIPQVANLPRQGLVFATKRVLRLGVILVGAQVTISELALLGPRVAVIATATLVATYLATTAAGRLLGVPPSLAKLIAAGTAVCGASAIMAANSVVRAKEEDVGYAVASITLYGTILMLVLPLAGPLFGMAPVTYGVWVGASVHEVAQVAAAGFQGGASAGETATLTKLMRVMLLAPLVLAMALAARGAGRGPERGPMVDFPWFVLGFILLVLINSAIELPVWLRDGASFSATLFLTTGMAAMGLAIDLRRMRQQGVMPLLLGAIATLAAVTVSYALIRLLLV